MKQLDERIELLPKRERVMGGKYRIKLAHNKIALAGSYDEAESILRRDDAKEAERKMERDFDIIQDAAKEQRTESHAASLRANHCRDETEDEARRFWACGSAAWTDEDEDREIARQKALGEYTGGF